jgi:2-phospho-L-lactate guanylyltransferase
VQATVAYFDTETRGGTLLADDGVLMEFSAAALEGSRLRLLRPGQRVRIAVGADGVVQSLQIPTLPKD